MGIAGLIFAKTSHAKFLIIVITLPLAIRLLFITHVFALIYLSKIYKYSAKEFFIIKTLMIINNFVIFDSK